MGENAMGTRVNVDTGNDEEFQLYDYYCPIIKDSESEEKNVASEDSAEKESKTNQEKAEDEPTAVSEEE